MGLKKTPVTKGTSNDEERGPCVPKDAASHSQLSFSISLRQCSAQYAAEDGAGEPVREGKGER
jgi:hypothetical protein